MFVVNIINSIIGKPGNIGYRFSYVQKEQIDQKIGFITVARGNVLKHTKNIFSLGVFSLIPRGLHYLRRNYFKRLNTRKADLLLFEFFFVLLLPYIYFKSRTHSEKVAYVIEISPFIVKALKRMGFRIVLDIPIAPNNYVKKAIDNYQTQELVYHSHLDERERLCFQLSDLVLVPSDFVYKEVVELTNKDKVEVIPFGSVQKPFRNTVAKLGKKHGLDFVFAGNVSSRKGVNFLLDAWDSPEFSNDTLHLCGNVTKEIKNKVATLEQSNIVFPGFINTQEYFEKCDVYVFPSLMEGSSKSVYEAMANSLPCIVTYQSGSVIEHKVDGLIINAFNTDELKSAMLQIKKMDLAEISKNAHVKSESYTWEKYIKQVMKALAHE
ncbi:glycosyltransferase family 4 protein [Pseudoalteromonas sp. ESRF-bin5]|uniref:glycosyltransferase family 4 protein n=1 Tax=Pseudoalteromonas sp. ESRF-bin5 TaxID=2014532 RepID=UPI00257B51F3|nr:glycosyltransferase family 4 protein [Pseudoalteromonas sp. ESRF-bin5]